MPIGITLQANNGSTIGDDLSLAGEIVSLPLAPGAFRRYRISFVHQHLGLIPSLSVVENLLINRLATEAH